MKSALLGFPVVFGLAVAIIDRSIGSGVVAFYLFVLVEVAAAWAAGRSWPRRGKTTITLAAIDAMDGAEFEGYVAGRLGRAGWEVRFTPVVGDYGVDLIAEKDGRCVAVQCKRYGKAVGVAAVQQVVAGARHHDCGRSIVVSNREFTAAAKQLARTHGCQLIGRRVLQTWVSPPAPRTV